MPDREPIEATNLDIYGDAPLPWSRARESLVAGSPRPETPFYLGTVRPDGRAHAAGIGALWHEGDFYIASGPETRKSRNLAVNPACTISGRLPGIDLIFEGEADRVTDSPTLETIAARYREGGWPAEVAGDALTAPYSAPSAGPPPWYLYRFTVHTVFGVATEEPYGAMRWRFSRVRSRESGARARHANSQEPIPPERVHALLRSCCDDSGGDSPHSKEAEMVGQRRLGRRTLATMAAATVPFGAIAFGEAAPAYAIAPQVQPGATTVDVYGNGSVRAVPDKASATIGIEVERPALGEAQAEASTLAAAVIAAVKAAGVADEDIRTANFSVRVVREREREKENGKEDGQQPVQPTFRVANAVEITVRDLDTLGAILDGAIAAGATTCRASGSRWRTRPRPLGKPARLP